ncbi:unnamed protein product [Microthlaspi erraticum]|uniref:3-oxo-5-alpha-steroid 4-dehydrogenase C-terminal domain-containing protein n=1 Tax=Microthlaspi erraticum TaxID=1685480 RepID=A0A6D2I104_9BRAS|nr:unnamed protein product [Microthlaspi erraticum]
MKTSMELAIVWLVRAAWIAATLPIVIAFIPSSKLRSFHQLVLGFVGRGKILQHSSSQKLTVPQRFFAHFYVIGVACTTLLLATTWMFACKVAPLSSSEEFQLSDIASRLTGGGSHVFSFHKSHLTPVEHRLEVWRAVFLLILMETQVVRRLIESIYVFKYSPSARMNILGYLVGICFYTGAPFSLCVNIAPEVARFAGNQVAEFIANGKGHSSSPEVDLVLSISPLMKLGLCQLIGGAVFLWGWLHQRRCHAILGSLRESPRQANEYIIPHGDWFEMVSSPHYLAEIVLYAGLVIASGGTDITIWLLFSFVVGNLTMAAGETHRWYLRKFENYPANRSAIFPYVY